MTKPRLAAGDLSKIRETGESRSDRADFPPWYTRHRVVATDGGIRPWLPNSLGTTTRDGAPLRIHRSSPEANFLILPNATAQDTRLSWAARGLLIELLSRPSDWETNADALWVTSKQQRGEQVGEGRRAVRAAFAMLEEFGYIVRSRTRVKKGRFVTTVDVYDTPGHHRGTADGTSADGTSVSGTSLQRTDLLKNRYTKHRRQTLRETR